MEDTLPEEVTIPTELSRLCKAMGHPVRFRILTLLAQGVCNVNELVEKLGVEQYKVSKHLTILFEAGLVTYRVNGRNRCYELSQPEVTREILELFGKLRGQLS